jgi:hypothetical protein
MQNFAQRSALFRSNVILSGAISFASLANEIEESKNSIPAGGSRCNPLHFLQPRRKCIQ